MNPRVAAIIPAFNESAIIARTLDAVAACAVADEIIVVSDGSTDDTARIALDFGARVIISERRRGKGAACAAGVRATTAGVLCMLDADLGESGNVAALLVPPVSGGETDMAIAAPPQSAPSGFGLVERLSRVGIQRLTGTRFRRPLSGQRALVRTIFDRYGFARGFAMETALTIDALRGGFRVMEIDAPVGHRKTVRNAAGFIHRARQGKDVVAAMAVRAFRG